MLIKLKIRRRASEINVEINYEIDEINICETGAWTALNVAVSLLSKSFSRLGIVSLDTTNRNKMYKFSQL